MDFDNRPTHLQTEGGAVRDIEEVSPIRVSGLWHFASDVPSDPYKTGWIYGRRMRRQVQAAKGDVGSIDFQCSNITYGRMKIGFISSYGKYFFFYHLKCLFLFDTMGEGLEWGSVNVFLSARVRSSSGHPEDFQFEPLQIKSKWQMAVSVRQEREIDLQNLRISNENRDVANMPRGCNMPTSAGPSYEERCIESITARIEFAKESGRKFKLQSIACC